MNATDGARTPLGMVGDIAACLAFMTRLDMKISGLDRARPIERIGRLCPSLEMPQSERLLIT